MVDVGVERLRETSFYGILLTQMTTGAKERLEETVGVVSEEMVSSVSRRKRIALKCQD